jgi:hypothetical protein
MAPTEARAPPWCVANRQQSDIYRAEFVRLRGQPRVAREEYARFARIKAIHVRAAEYAVLRAGGPNRDMAYRASFAWGGCDRLAAETTSYRRRREEWDIARERGERAAGQVIGVAVRDQNSVQRWETIERETGRGNAPQHAGEARIEIRIREHAHAADFDQQRGVPDVRYPRAGAARAGVGVLLAAFARSLDKNHCCGNVAIFWTA